MQQKQTVSAVPEIPEKLVEWLEKFLPEPSASALDTPGVTIDTNKLMYILGRRSVAVMLRHHFDIQQKKT